MLSPQPSFQPRCGTGEGITGTRTNRIGKAADVGDRTGIEWTDATWNPVTGCSKVSAGCKHCYAERVFPRAYAGQMASCIKCNGSGMRGHEGGTCSRCNGAGVQPLRFTDVLCHPERLDQPLRWRKPRRVFVNSMSDLFHPDVPDGFIARVWDVMGRCPQHTFQILTKRPERMRAWVSRWADQTGDRDNDTSSGMPPMPRGPQAVRATYTSGRAHLFADMLDSMGPPPEGAAYPLYDWSDGQRFWFGDRLPNVWLGVSVEDQATADERIPVLLDTHAALRFVSYEPALGPVDFRGYLRPIPDDEHDGTGPVSWIIVGGESGPGARPFDVQWASDTITQCRAAGVQVFVKQLGGNPVGEWWHDGGTAHHRPDITATVKHRSGSNPDEWPDDLRVREYPEVEA